MNKLRKEQKDKITGIAIGAVLISILLWYFLIGAQHASITKLGESSREIEDKVSKAEIRLKRARMIQADLEDLRGKLGAEESQLIPSEQVSGMKWLFDTIKSFIDQGSYDVSLTRIADPDINKRYLILPKMDYSAVSYTVELRGYFHELGKFIANFENQFPYMSIHRVQISPLATPSSGGAAASEVADDISSAAEREKLTAILRVTLVFKPAGVL